MVRCHATRRTRTGTAFWSVADAGVGRCKVDATPPTHVIAPSAGSALLFGGQVTHAAQPVVTGERIVFVASFSPTSRFGPKRTRALHAGFGGLRAAASGLGRRAEGRERPPGRSALRVDAKAAAVRAAALPVSAPRHAAAGVVPGVAGVSSVVGVLGVATGECSLEDLCIALTGDAVDAVNAADAVDTVDAPTAARVQSDAPPYAPAWSAQMIAHEEEVD